MGLALDGVFAFSRLPLRMATFLGLASVVATLVYVAYSVFARFFLNDPVRGFTALLVTIVFFAGVQLVTLGVLGEYVGRTYEEIKQRPLYTVDRLVGAVYEPALSSSNGSASPRARAAPIGPASDR